MLVDKFDCSFHVYIHEIGVVTFRLDLNDVVLIESRYDIYDSVVLRQES